MSNGANKKALKRLFYFGFLELPRLRPVVNQMLYFGATEIFKVLRSKPLD